MNGASLWAEAVVVVVVCGVCMCVVVVVAAAAAADDAVVAGAAVVVVAVVVDRGSLYDDDDDDDDDGLVLGRFSGRAGTNRLFSLQKSAVPVRAIKTTNGSPRRGLPSKNLSVALTSLR